MSEADLTATLELLSYHQAFDGGANMVRCAIRLTVYGFGDPIRTETTFSLADRELAACAEENGGGPWDERDIVICLARRTNYAVTVPPTGGTPLPTEPGAPRPLALRVLDRLHLTPAKYGG